MIFIVPAFTTSDSMIARFTLGAIAHCGSWIISSTTATVLSCRGLQFHQLGEYSLGYQRDVPFRLGLVDVLSISGYDYMERGTCVSFHCIQGFFAHVFGVFQPEIPSYNVFDSPHDTCQVGVRLASPQSRHCSVAHKQYGWRTQCSPCQVL